MSGALPIFRGGSGGRSAPGRMRRVRALIVGAAILLLVTRPAGAAQRAEPVRLALVIPISSAPLFTPTGEPSRDANSRVSKLGDALRVLARPELEDIPFALAPSPLLCDELQQLGGGAAARALTALRALERVPVLSSPYAEIRLSTLSTPRAVREELSDGYRPLERCTGGPPDGIVAPPDLRLSSVALEGVAAFGASALLARSEDVRVGPVIWRSATFIPADNVLPQYTPDATYGAFQRFEAAAAVLPIERPDLGRFILALSNDPRIALTSIRDLPVDARQGFTSFASPRQPSASYRRAFASALRSVERFRRYTLPNNRLTAVMRTSVARARSSAEWDEDWSIGRARARGIVRALAKQEELVSASGGSVTFTSQSGSVPVTVTNSATYPVRVRVQLSSTKLRFPDGSSRTVTVDPPGDTIVFAALARSTGSFPVQVRVTSPDDVIGFHSGELTVRSTAANVPALVITSAAAIFLLVWYGRHLSRRRRERRPTT